MTEHEPRPDYDTALAKVRESQRKLAAAMTRHLPPADRADAVQAVRNLLHDMDGLYMSTFSRMIEQINSMHDQRWIELSGEQRAIGDRQGRHAGKIAALEAFADDVRRILELDTPHE